MRVVLVVLVALLLVVPAASAQVGADVSIANSTNPEGRPGGPVAYFIQVKNLGPAAAANITFTDAVPASTRFITEQHPPGAACSVPQVAASGTVSCTMTALQPGSTALFYLEVQIDASAPVGTVISDIASISAANDPNTSNNSSTATLTVGGSPYVSCDVSVTSAGIDSALAGSLVTYDVTVMNNGPADAESVSLVDAIPDNSTLLALEQTSGPAFTCVAQAGNRHGLRCSIDLLRNGASATFAITVRVDPGCPTGTISNDVSVATTTPDLIRPNDASAKTAVTAVPGSTSDLSVAINPPRAVPPGGLLTTYLEAVNMGPADATNAEVKFDVPPETIFLYVKSPDGATCLTPAPGASGTIACTVPLLRNEQSATFAVSVGLNPKPAATSIAESVSVSSATPDTDLTFNSASAIVLVDVADLSITQSPASASVHVGSNLVYTLRVMNAGPSPAGAVTVDDALPPGATLVSATPSQGLCNGTSCSLGTIESGASATILLTITAPVTAGTLTNTAFVRSSTADVTIKNNASASSVAVVTSVPCVRRSASPCWR